MKKILFAILLIPLLGIAQIPDNFVPNSDFEYPTTIDRCHTIWRLTNWRQTTNGNQGSPDWISHSNAYYVMGCNYLNCPTNSLGGDKYLFIGKDPSDSRGESIFNEFPNSLTEGKKYKIRLWATGKPGDNFVVRILKNDNDWSTGLPDLFVCTIPNGSSNNYCKGYAFETVFTASKPDLKLLGVSALGGNNGSCYVYIDNVEIYEYCTDYIVRQCREYKQETELEEAANIIAGRSVVNNPYLCDVTMFSGSITKYKASTEVNLKEGFNVDRGADFHAKIAECGSECSSTNFDLPMFYELCNNNCIQIGLVAAKYGLSYTWSSSIPSNLNYLSNLNIANPVFCIPPGVFGSFTFELTVTNSCGEQTKRTVTIEVPENTTPGFSILQNNLSSKPIYPELSILPVLNTEKIIVDIMDCNGNILYTKTYTDGIDFYANNSQTIQPIQWTLNEFLIPCDCYKIRIRSKNYCNENYKEEILSWDRPKTPINLQLPTLARCINGQIYFCFGGDGFSAMKLELFNRWGESVFNGKFLFSSSPFCLPVAGGNQLPSGTYALIVDVIDCYGRITKHNSTIFIPSCGDELVGDNIQGDGVTLNNNVKYIKPDGSIDSVYTYIYPNPVNETSKIQFYLPVKSKVKLTVLNSNFESKCFILNSVELSEGKHEYSIPEGCFLSHGVNYYMLETLDIENIKIIQRFSVN